VSESAFIPVLHHYKISPFSEKVRLVLGYKGLAWRSVTVPNILPKPDVLALTGGYRKTPFLQIGADIYCDTALICEVLEHLQPQPSLYPTASKGVARVLAQWADSTLFWGPWLTTSVPKAQPLCLPMRLQRPRRPLARTALPCLAV